MSDSLLEQGKKQLQNQDYAGAIATFTAFIQDDPYSVEAFYQRGVAHFKADNIYAAVSDYGKALECDSEYAKAYYARALARVALDNPTGAFSDSESAIQWQPDHAAAYQLRGRLYRKRGDRNNAIADFRMAAQFFLTQQKPERAQDCLQTVETLEAEHTSPTPLNRSTETKSSDIIQKILTQAQWGDTQQAMVDLTEVLGQRPNDGQAYCCRGLVHLKKGSMEAAISDFNQAIALGFQEAIVYRSRSKAKLQLGETQGAIADANQALSSQEESASFVARGNAYRALEHHLGALEDYAAALTKDRENGEIYYERGLTYEAMGEIPQAIADYQRAMNLLCNQEEWDAYKQVKARLDYLKIPSSEKSQPRIKSADTSQQRSEHLYTKLLGLLGGNQDLADGMIKRMSHTYPERSREWLLESVIHNLEQDMGR